MRRGSWIGLLSLVGIVSACGGPAVPSATPAPVVTVPIRPAAAPGQGAYAPSPLTSDLVALAERAAARSVHWVQLAPDGSLYIRVWTGERVEQRDSRIPDMPTGGSYERTAILPGVPAAEFPLGDVERARVAVGDRCAPTIQVGLTAGGQVITTADCPDDVRAVVFIDGVEQPVPDYWSQAYLATQLEFAAGASPDGRVWSISLANAKSVAYSLETRIVTTGGTSVNGVACEVFSFQLPAPGRFQHRLETMGCDLEFEPERAFTDGQFDPRTIEPAALKRAVDEAVAWAGPGETDALLTLQVGLRAGAPVLTAQKPWNEFREFPIR